MLRFTLAHYGTGSVITCLDDLQHIGAITYTRKIHRYESESDYQTIITELKTYSDRAAMDVFEYLQGARGHYAAI